MRNCARGGVRGRDAESLSCSWAKSNRLEDLLPLAEGCRSALPSIRAGEVLRVGE
jgi:hypothetical protein